MTDVDRQAVPGVEHASDGEPLIPVVDPVSVEETAQDDQLRDGTALCLSGGGSPAMLFHLGALRRLNEVGLLGTIERISSVSGGSIVAGVLGRRWNRLAASLQEHLYADATLQDLPSDAEGPRF